MNEIQEKLQVIEQQIAELEEFNSSLNGLKNLENRDALVSLGKGVFASAELKKEKFFVEVGSGKFVRKDLEETKKVVGEQIQRLTQLRAEISSQVNVAG